MSPLVTSQLRLATDAMTLVASASVCVGFLWLVFRVRTRIGPRLRPMAMMSVFIAAIAGANVLHYVAGFFPGHVFLNIVAAAVAAVALALALAIWAFIPGLSREPTHNELVTAVGDLRAERDARRSAVDELSRARDELERRVAERTSGLDLARRRFETALQGTGIVVAHQDRDLRYTWMYNPPAPLKGADTVGRLPDEILPADLARQQAAIKRRVLNTGEAGKFEALYPTANGPIWYEGRVEPLMVDGRVEGVMTVSIDVTRHVLHERQLRVLMRELTHRSKNLLAVVQGMARQSSIGASDVSVFMEGFDSRLSALSRAHEILVDANWRGVSLRAILDREIAALATPVPGLKVDGPHLLLSPEAAQNFTLAINELAGDLRNVPPDAQMEVDVNWRVDNGALRFDWRRNGGGPGAQFDGFGQNLLNRVLPRQIGGAAQLSQSQDACAYALEGKVELLAPLGRRALASDGRRARRRSAKWRPRQDSNL